MSALLAGLVVGTAVGCGSGEGDAAESREVFAESVDSEEAFIGINDMPSAETAGILPALVDAEGAEALVVYSEWPGPDGSADPVGSIEGWPRLANDHLQLHTEFQVAAATVLSSSTVGADGIPIEETQTIVPCDVGDENSVALESAAYQCAVIHEGDSSRVRVGELPEGDEYVIVQFEWFVVNADPSEDPTPVMVSYAFEGSGGA